MASHQKLVSTQEHLNLKKEYRLIRDKIVEFKKEFRKYNEARVGEMYRILTEIVKLKSALPENRGVGRRYTFRSLEWEQDINISAMDLRYIEAYKWISDYGKEKVQEGLIHDSTICHFLAISSLLREEKYQNKLIDLVIAQKIKVSAVSEVTKEELKLFLEGKFKIKIDDQYLLTATKTIRSVKKRLIERKHLLKDSMFSDNLKRAIIDLYKEIVNIEDSAAKSGDKER